MAVLTNAVRKHEQDVKDNIIKKLKRLKKTGAEFGLTEDETKNLIEIELFETYNQSQNSNKCTKVFYILLCLLLVVISMNITTVYDFTHNQCVVTNNYAVMEVTRPITDCSICKGIKNFRILKNVSKAMFSKYAYLGQPMLVRGACANSTALNRFSFDFFKKLYNETPGAYASVEEECQFFPFKTDFLTLKEVFSMSESRAKMLSSDEERWYIGWSNCNPAISSILRKLYSLPYFLPDDSELSAIDWIFMGYSGTGASMHLDYVQRPSWQTQIAGSKTWFLQPTPECESVCDSMNITAQQGDIILIDTNQWYHTTFIEGDEMSITLGSEYD